MHYYKTIIQYDGSERSGFQWQMDQPTIQGDLNLTLHKILPGRVTTCAASRTDKGVHAFGQVVKISSEHPLTHNLSQLNQELPPHIRCLEITPCTWDFIPSIDQHSKEYRYLFTNKHGVGSGEHRYIAQIPSPLNIGNILSCVALLKGTNDFRNFWSIGGTTNSTLREILHCDLTMIDPRDLFRDSLFTAGETESCWQFRIVGTGFLKHMVRHLVGALWMVGNERLAVGDFHRYLHGELKEQRPWKKADPRGLYLLKVSYGSDEN